ncbi:hypothetical protein KGQ20_29485 [Catenulispora sp. NF23]|uniref:hypothetical protein n=1 Tax=Catenulispora pinistramenti TaxID=2705254 RepID=UPI001BAAC93B|nr:hypothetical protein [Catenulispora pinistramenti]MBS2536904.1 hypothetical protein [Catenulispora pinistramenti]
MITPSPPRRLRAVTQLRPSQAAALIIRVLWALVPIVSVGTAAWVPSMVFALRRPRKRRAKIWFAVFLTGVAGFITLLIVVPGDRKSSGGGAQLFAGTYTVVYILGASVHAFIASKDPRPLRERSGAGSAMQGYSPTPWQPTPWQPTFLQHPQYGQLPQFAPQMHDGQQPPVGYSPPPAWPAPTRPPLDDTAAEVQAELRELRKMLDEGRA